MRRVELTQDTATRETIEQICGTIEASQMSTFLIVVLILNGLLFSCADRALKERKITRQ